jgi:integrase
VDIRPSTRARDEANLRNHVLPRFARTRLGSMDHFEIREWVTDLTDSGLAPATVQKIHQVLSKALRAAVDGKKLPNNPADRVPLPAIEREEMRFLLPSEINQLVELVPRRSSALVLLDCYAGLRIGEIAGLRRGRLDLVGGTVRVAETAVEVRGELQLGPPKTKAGRRTVPIPGFVVEALVEHLDQFVDRDPDAFVFAGASGGILRPNAWRQRVWNKATRAAGVEGVRPHDMRHTAISLWIAAGASPKQVATWAGHTSVSLVIDRYGHLFPGNAEPVLARLDQLHRGEWD